MVRTHMEGAVCPACNAQGMEYRAETIDLPYLGESLETMLRCNECGFRHTDFVLTATKAPTRHTLTVTSEDDISVRVVRSSSGTIRIPELGILIEPGVASDAFISNVEGIIVRVESILAQLERDAIREENQESVERIAALRDVFQQLRNGTAPPTTVIIEDPFGNSAILAEKVVVETMPEGEAAALKTGMFVFDQGDAAEAA